MIKVRSHTRIKKNGVSIVRKHLRKLKTKYGITTPVKVNLGHEATQSDSLAHHAAHVKNNKPVKHEINLDVKKIKRAGENVEAVLKHELNHVVDIEKARGKNGKLNKPTDTYSQKTNFKRAKGKSAKETFADKHKF